MTHYRSRSASTTLAFSVAIALTVGLIAGPGCQSAVGLRQNDEPTEPSTGSSAQSNLEALESGDNAGQRIRSLEEVPLAAQKRVAKLASPEFAGRGYLRDGHNRAATFIADEFSDIGLLPIDNSYFRSFELEADLFPSTPSLRIDGQELKVGIDFIPFPGSASGSRRDLELVDLKHGLYDPDKQLSDFTSDVAGQVVLVRDGIPDSLASADRNGMESIEYKAFVAASKGAVGMVVATDHLVYGLSKANAPIPVFEIATASLHGDASMISFELESSPNTLVETRNVLGYLPANSKSKVDSLVLVGAHYDHQGALGEDSFFPGANDNASGVAMLLDIAEHFVERRRSKDVLFVAFSGEEVGLLGSKEFVRSPPVDLSRISLVVNLDMVASAEDGLVVMGGVENVSEFDEISKLALSLDGGAPENRAHRIRSRSTTPISDHYPFFEAGIRSLYFYTNKGTQPYHSVLDVPETLEWDDYNFTKSLIIRFLENKFAKDD